MIFAIEKITYYPIVANFVPVLWKKGIYNNIFSKTSQKWK